MNTLLQFSDVHLQYQNGQNLTEVIKGINFSINQNERLAIVGKSGSGKTSLLMLMAGLEKPTLGSIKFQNQELMQPLLSKLLNQNRKYRYFVNVDYNMKWSG